MKKILLVALASAVVIVLALVMARNVLIREGVGRSVRNNTGLPLRIEFLYWNLRTGWISARKITLLNPPHFEDRLFAEVQELYVELDWMSLFRRETHIKNLLLNIDRIEIVKDTNGNSNAAHLKGTRSGNEVAAKYRIDNARLILSTVTVKDYSSGKLVEKTYPLNIDATYRNITDATDINRLILYSVLKNVPLNINLTVEQLAKGLGRLITLPAEILKGTAEVLENTGKGLIDTIKK